MPPTLVTAHIWILFLKVPILFKLIAKDAFLFRVQILVPWHWHWLMYSAVLVFTYMLLERVSSTTLAEVGLHALSILYVSLGSTQCQAPDVSLPSTRVPCYPSVSCQVGCPRHLCVAAHWCGFFTSATLLHPRMCLESTLLRSVWWFLDWSLSVKTASFQMSMLDLKFILDLYHISLSIPLSRQAMYIFISLMLWMVPWVLVCCVWCLKSVHFWTIAGEDLIYHTVSTSLFVFLPWHCTFLIMRIMPLTRSIPSVP